MGTLGREVRLLYCDLKSCIVRVCLRIEVRHSQTNPWWNDELSAQRRSVRQLQQREVQAGTTLPCGFSIGRL